MKRYNFVLFLLCTMVLFWGILNSDLSLENIAIGFMISIAVLFISHVFVSDSDLPDLRLSHLFIVIAYAFVCFIRIIPSSLNVMRAIFKNNSRVERVRVILPSSYKFINALVCNTITLTPGTVTMEFFEKEAEILVINPDNKSHEELIEEIESGFKTLERL